MMSTNMYWYLLWKSIVRCEEDTVVWTKFVTQWEREHKQKNNCITKRNITHVSRKF